jgi:hypothetical protein
MKVGLCAMNFSQCRAVSQCYIATYFLPQHRALDSLPASYYHIYSVLKLPGQHEEFIK